MLCSCKISRKKQTKKQLNIFIFYFLVHSYLVSIPVSTHNFTPVMSLNRSISSGVGVVFYLK